MSTLLRKWSTIELVTGWTSQRTKMNPQEEEQKHTMARSESTDNGWKDIDSMLNDLGGSKDKEDDFFATSSKTFPPKTNGIKKRGRDPSHETTGEALATASFPSAPMTRRQELMAEGKPFTKPRSLTPSPSKTQTLTYSLQLSEQEIKALKRLSVNHSIKVKRDKSSSFIHNLKRVGSGGTVSSSSGQVFLQKIADEWEREAKKAADEWTKKAEYATKWEQDTVVPEGVPLIDLACKKQGFNIEFGKPGTVLEDTYELEDREKEIPYYKNFIADRDHDNIVGEDKILGSIIASVESKEKGGIDQRILRCIIRTKKGDRRIAILGRTERPFPDSAEGKIKALKEAVPEYSDLKFNGIRETEHKDSITDLLLFEQNQLTPNYKFGILYMKQGQKEENEFFNNVGTSKEFDDFLSCIGDRVPLKGFTGFAGGLDTKYTTGTESVHVRHKNYEIMFHVSTMLPFFPKDPQQVERKRHLGNDVVVVVFKENSEDSFPAHMISSQFNHVFVGVQPDAGGYRVAVANKPGVRPYGPSLPFPAFFEKGPKFREFFLTKLINAEIAAMYAPDFRQRLSKTREMMLRQIIERNYKEKKGATKRRDTVKKIGDSLGKVSEKIRLGSSRIMADTDSGSGSGKSEEDCGMQTLS